MLVVASPALLVKDAETQANREAEEKEFLALKSGIQSGDRTALEKCVMKCADYLVFKDEKHTLRRQAALTLIRFDSPHQDVEHQLPMMVAYSVLSTEQDSAGRWQINLERAKRGWELLQGLPADVQRNSRFKDAIVSLASDLFISRLLALPEGQAQQEIEHCVQNDLLPRHSAIQYRPIQCSSEYLRYKRYRFGKRDAGDPPPALETDWNTQAWVEDIKMREREWIGDGDNAAVAAGVENGERSALEACVQHCPGFQGARDPEYYWRSRYEPLRQRAALKLIALDRPGATPDNLTHMVVSYTLTALEKLPAGGLRLKAERIERGDKLAKLDASHPEHLTEFAPYRLALRLEALSTDEQSNAFKNCVSDRWLQDYAPPNWWPSICEKAYKLHALLHGFPTLDVPWSLKKPWEEDRKIIESGG